MDFEGFKKTYYKPLKGVINHPAVSHIRLMPEAPSEAEIQMVGQLAARWSIGSILILFLIGGILLYFVDDEKGREEARYLAEH